MNSTKLISKENLLPFILVTVCFALWGFANDITNPMVKSFSKIFLMSNFQGSLVQFAFYLGYFAMAIPAAIFIKKFSYKSGILVGLGLYALGGLMFVPASLIGQFAPFLLAYFTLTCGLSFLETSANPYILSMGEAATSTRRLNLAQAFNPLGSLTGMFVAQQYIQAKLDPRDFGARAALPFDEFEALKMADLEIVRMPYVAIGGVILLLFALIYFTNMPRSADTDTTIDLKGTFSRLFAIPHYREGVIAQMFYVGAQIMCWTFIIHYGTEIFMAQGMAEAEAERLSQSYNIAAMIIFASSRFICTFLLRYISPGKLLGYLAVAGFLLVLVMIFIGGMTGLYALVAVSACMSLMFPTIYGIALQGTGEDAKFAAAGLVMAILGGSVMPPLQGLLIDTWSVQASFMMPAICFVVVAAYGFRVAKL